jgi:hypothetical protein
VGACFAWDYLSRPDLSSEHACGIILLPFLFAQALVDCRVLESSLSHHMHILYVNYSKQEGNTCISAR